MKKNIVKITIDDVMMGKVSKDIDYEIFNEQTDYEHKYMQLLLSDNLSLTLISRKEFTLYRGILSLEKYTEYYISSMKKFLTPLNIAVNTCVYEEDNSLVCKVKLITEDLNPSKLIGNLYAFELMFESDAKKIDAKISNILK